MKHTYQVPSDSAFRKSSRSGDGSGSGDGCVSVAITEQAVFVRDTKDASKTTLIFNHCEWRAFLAGAAEGEFNM